MEPLNYFKIGNEKLKELKFFDALTFYNKVLSLEPKNISCIISKGIVFELINNKTLADLHFSEAYELSKDDVELWIERAYFSELLNHNLAIKLYEYAIAISPEDIFSLGRLLLLYTCIGETAKKDLILSKLNTPYQKNYLHTTLAITLK